MKIVVTDQHTRILRFLISGASAAATEYGIFIVLIHVLALPVVVSNSLSFLCGLAVSFTLNKAWVFGSKQDSARQLVSYLVLALINLLLSNLFVIMLTDLFNRALVAKFITMGLIALWNYFIFSKLIFKEPTQI